MNNTLSSKFLFVVVVVVGAIPPTYSIHEMEYTSTNPRNRNTFCLLYKMVLEVVYYIIILT